MGVFADEVVPTVASLYSVLSTLHFYSYDKLYNQLLLRHRNKITNCKQITNRRVL